MAAAADLVHLFPAATDVAAATDLIQRVGAAGLLSASAALGDPSASEAAQLLAHIAVMTDLGAVFPQLQGE